MKIKTIQTVIEYKL